VHGRNRLGMLPLFAKLASGTHIKHKKYVTVLTGNQITVTFDRACAMQVDGDVYPKTYSYTVTAPDPVGAFAEEKQLQTV